MTPEQAISNLLHKGSSGVEVSEWRLDAAEVIRTLAAENAALRKDAAIVDWIECRAMNGQIQIAQSLRKTGYETAIIGRGERILIKVYRGTLRAAIDEAMKDKP